MRHVSGIIHLIYFPVRFYFAGIQDERRAVCGFFDWEKMPVKIKVIYWYNIQLKTKHLRQLTVKINNTRRNLRDGFYLEYIIQW